MLRGLSGWLGMSQAEEKENLSLSEEAGTGEVHGRDTEPRSHEEAEPKVGLDPLFNQAKGLGSYLFSFATTATKKISESVAETAQTVKKSVEEGKIESILDKTVAQPTQFWMTHFILNPGELEKPLQGLAEEFAHFLVKKSHFALD